MIRFHCLLVLFFSLVSSVPSYYYQSRACCSFKGPHFESTEYIVVFSLNKHEMVEYNSTRGNWTGFTAFSVMVANDFHNNPRDAPLRNLEKKLLCEKNMDLIKSLGNLTTAPTVNIKSLKQHDGRHQALLVCSAYNFYPKKIQMTWLRNNEDVTSGLTYSDVMADGDLYFQIHSFLEYTPSVGETITCVVEHASLSEPKLIIWDNSLPAKKHIQIIVGVSGLVLGIVLMSSGLIFYKKKSAANTTVSQEQTLVPMDHISAN
ncbi:rano class II histocompatibility antigen, A beta chain-like [Menidia menidia]